MVAGEAGAVVVVVVVVVEGAVVAGAGAVAGAVVERAGGVGNGATDFEAAGFEPGDVDAVGATGVCPAAILNAASDSATKQRGRSTRYV